LRKDANKRWRALKRETTTGYLMILPVIAYITFFFFFPIAYTFSLSLQRYDLLTGDIKFVGLTNYFSILRDERFINSLKVTLLFTSICVCTELVIGMFLALLLSQNIKGIKIFRTLLLMPLMITPVVYSLQFRWMYADQYGVINNILRAIGIEGPLWIGDPNISLYSISIVMVWAATPFVMLVILAGIQSIPTTFYEAAQIDGASSWGRFRHVTLPLLKPAILFVLLIRIIDAFRMFDIPYVITGGGPAYSTELLSLYVYSMAFRFLDIGKASSAAVIMLLISLAMCITFILLLERREFSRR